MAAVHFSPAASVNASSPAPSLLPAAVVLNVKGMTLTSQKGLWTITGTAAAPGTLSITVAGTTHQLAIAQNMSGSVALAVALQHGDAFFEHMNVQVKDFTSLLQVAAPLTTSVVGSVAGLNVRGAFAAQGDNTFSISGTATAAGSLTVNVAGVALNVAVKVGDDFNAVAANISKTVANAFGAVGVVVNANRNIGGSNPTLTVSLLQNC